MADAAPKDKPALAAVAKAPKVVKPLLMGDNWKLEEFAFNRFRAVVGESVEVEDLTNPELWSIVASQLHPLDRITVVRSDRKFYVELLVADATISSARLVMLGAPVVLPPMLSDSGHVDPPGYDFHQSGITGRWFVRRLADGRELLSEPGLESKREAVQFVADHASNRRS